jgi:hypothetical protein
LTKKIVVYVKNEGANLNTMKTALKLVISCEASGVMENFHGICFGYVFFKGCQYAIAKKKA